jgi:hypothetical protein
MDHAIGVTRRTGIEKTHLLEGSFHGRAGVTMR